jgi:hypothetical protein
MRSRSNNRRKGNNKLDKKKKKNFTQVWNKKRLLLPQYPTKESAFTSVSDQKEVLVLLLNNNCNDFLFHRVHLTIIIFNCSI